MKSKDVRLTKRQENKVFINEEAIPRKNCRGRIGFHFCRYGASCENIFNRKCPVLKMLDKLAYYEDLEEQGRLVIKKEVLNNE